jgi:ABC-type dipeptide/oligopeptide/nickel transport system permease subunit
LPRKAGRAILRQAEYAQKAPWLVIFRGLATGPAVSAMDLLGDARRDTLGPCLRDA